MDPETGETTRHRWGRTQCKEIEVTASSVTLEVASGRHQRPTGPIRVSLYLDDEDHLLTSPRTEHAGIGWAMKNSCAQKFELIDEDETSVLTTAGRLYRSSEACGAVEGRFEERCDAEGCVQTPEGHPVFQVKGCETPFMSHPVAIAARSRGMEYQDRKNVVDVVERLGEGRDDIHAWDRVAGECVEVEVEHVEEKDMVRLTTTTTLNEPRPGRAVTEEEYRFEPLLGRAEEGSRYRSTFYGGDGTQPGGMSGSSGYGWTPVVFVEGAFHVGGRWYFVSSEACTDGARYYELQHGYRTWFVQ